MRLTALCTPVVLALLLPGAAAAQDFGPVTDADYRDVGQSSADLVELGRLLFFDPVLSGNRNISCATCHHPLLSTADGLSLGLGEGAAGLGTERDPLRGTAARALERVSRNAPAIFNLAARPFRQLFHDGRVAAGRGPGPGPGPGFRSPAGADLPEGLADVLAVQAMFPVASPVEMAGQARENEVGRAAARERLAGAGGVWDLLAGRLRGIPGYRRRFRAAFDDVDARGDITFVHAASAIAAYEAAAGRSDDSPFDRYLRGDDDALTALQHEGRELFYGRADCARCHPGPFQTDQRFRSAAMPQIGPGKGDGVDGREDFGRERVTGEIGDRYRFRTPSLRNVELTAPYGHAGAYATLEAVVRHYDDPERALREYDPGQLLLPSRPDLDALDLVVMSDPARVARIAASSEVRPVRLSQRDVEALVAFLRSLTDPGVVDLIRDIPATVPSGLSVDGAGT